MDIELIYELNPEGTIQLILRGNVTVDGEITNILSPLEDSKIYAKIRGAIKRLLSQYNNKVKEDPITRDDIRNLARVEEELVKLIRWLSEGRAFTCEKCQQVLSLKNIEEYSTICDECIDKNESKSVKTEELDLDNLPQAYSSLLKTLYNEGYISDLDNIDEDLKEDIIANGYEQDYNISIDKYDDLIIVKTPFAYGGPDLRVSSNYITLYKDLARVSDGFLYDATEYPIIDDETNEIDYEASYAEGWINIDNLEDIEEDIYSL